MMPRDEFARFLGFIDWMTLVGASEFGVCVGDISWFVTRLPNGLYAVWNTAELWPQRVKYYVSREEALRDQFKCFIDGLKAGILQPDDWLGPEPEEFGLPISIYSLKEYESEGGQYGKSSNGGEAVDPKVFDFAVKGDIDDILDIIGGSPHEYWADDSTGFYLHRRLTPKLRVVK